MLLILIPLALIGIGAVFSRFEVARLSANEFQPEVAETFLRWKKLKLRRLDVVIAGVTVLFAGLAFLVLSGGSLEILAPLIGVTFWTCLITGYVLQRKAARLEDTLNKGRRDAASVASPQS